MARRQQFIACPPEAVWGVLADGHSYAEWVVGTQDIEHVDPGWPAVGAALRYRAGLGPLTIDDSCTVRICEPGTRLELEAKAAPFGTARIAFTLIPWGANTLVLLDEHPLTGPGSRFEGPPSEFVLHLRNRRLLGNLARVAVEEHRQATGTGAGRPGG
ncbi:SRPBCC family protein [Streptomyces sp. BE20]|uniref:SRPBCC family protein n=1 Tax=Streptomycetaceae TaxID=2062 RepID=UPI002E765C45|nr:MULTISPECIES: SRPBCC family protein [unclassified Streptomyces]MED7952074.1 SRPBCC family protein [Streptomyces sp. BE303]MEE1822404.1 SRPBCC family protein [Streptomyces sp. BE20]